MSKKRPGQKVFKAIISQSLEDIEYDSDIASRWRPKHHQDIVIDPTRNFGTPILDHWGIATNSLYKEYLNDFDIRYLSTIYEISPQEIGAAISFEKKLDSDNGKRLI